MNPDKPRPEEVDHFLPSGERLKPLVFMDQPKDIEVLPPDRLHEWEQNVIAWAALVVKEVRSGQGGSCGFTISGSPRSADDSVRD